MQIGIIGSGGMADGKAKVHADYRKVIEDDSVDIIHIARPITSIPNP